MCRGRWRSRCAGSIPHGWIDSQIVAAYTRLHELGWAHSIETRNADGELVGGVYGISVGAMFAGESMFHTETDASKAALVHLTKTLKALNIELFDVQWMTSHLSSLGAIDLSRSEYLRRLEQAISTDRQDPRIILSNESHNQRGEA